MKKILKIASLALLLGLQAGSIVAEITLVNYDVPSTYQAHKEFAQNYPLHHAIACGRYDNAKRLIELGLWSREVTDNLGDRTAAQFAAQCAKIKPDFFNNSEKYREKKSRAYEIFEALEKHSPGTLEYHPNKFGSSPLEILERNAKHLCKERQQRDYGQGPCQASQELIAKCRQAIEKYKPEQSQQ